jgi:hypothetical protein
MVMQKVMQKALELESQLQVPLPHHWKALGLKVQGMKHAQVSQDQMEVMGQILQQR